MPASHHLLAAAAAALIALSAASAQEAAPGHAQAHAMPMGHGGAMDGDALRPALDALHARMTAAPTGDPDADFLLAMIPHHEGAVLMAQDVMAQAEGDAEVRELARRVIEAQGAELDWMRGWLRENGYGEALDAAGG